MEDKRSTPSRVGMTPIIGIVIIVVMALAIVPILTSVSSNISLADALTILGQHGYIAYASPTGDLTVNGNLAVTGNGSFGGNVTISGNLYITGSIYGANVTGGNLTQEDIEDYVGGLINDADSVQTRITVTYQDATNSLDFVVDNLLGNITLGANTTGIYVGNITGGNAITVTGQGVEGANVTINFDGGAAPGGELGGTWANPTVDSGIHDDEYIELSDTFGGEVSGNYTSIVINNDALDDQYIELGDTFGGEVSGNYTNIVINNNALDDQYYDSEADLTALLNDNYFSSEANLTALLNDNYYSSEANLTALLDDNYIELSDIFGGDVNGNYTAIVIGADAVALTTDTTGNYVANLTAGAGITVSGGGTENANVTVSATLGTSITSSEIVDSNITEPDLYISNAPTDNYILSYNAATGGFTWVQDQAGNDTFSATTVNDVTWGNDTDGNITWTFDPSGNNVILNIWPQVFNISTGTLQEGGYDVLTINDSFGGDVSGIYNAIAIAADAVKAADIDWGDLTDLDEGGTVIWGNIAEGELADSTVVEADLKAIDAPHDEEILTYDTYIGDFEWETPEELFTAGNGLTWSANDTIDFDGGDSPSGELGGTWANPTVDSGIHDDEYIELSDTFGGEVSGNYTNIVIDNDALDDQYYDSESDLTTLLNNNYYSSEANLTALLNNNYYSSEANLTALLDDDYIDEDQAFAGEVTGTYDATVVDNDALDDQYIELADTFGGDVSGNYTAIVIGPNAVTLGSDTTGNYISSVAGGAGISISGSGAEIANVTVTAILGANITGNEIVDGNITEVDLYATNAATDNYILSYDDATGGFTWVQDQTGSGSFDATIQNVVTWGNDTNGNMTWTFDPSGNNVIVNIWPQVFNVSTGTLQEGGYDVLTINDNFGGDVSGTYLAIVIGNDAVDDAHINWGNLTDLGEHGTVTWGNLGEGELADSSIVSADIKDDTIDSADYAPDSIDNEHINWANLTDLDNQGVVVWGNLGEGELADSSVVSADIKDDTIDSGDYAADSIDEEHINWANMTDLGDLGVVTWGNLGEGELADDSIVSADIKDDTIDSADYNADSIDDEHINWGSGANQIDQTDIPNGAKLYFFSATIFNPDGIQSTLGNITIFPIEAESFPNGITFTDLGIKTNAASNYTLLFQEWTAPTTYSSLLESVSTSSATEAEDDGTIANGTGGGAGDCNAGSILKVTLPTTDVDELVVWGSYKINDS